MPDRTKTAIDTLLLKIIYDLSNASNYETPDIISEFVDKALVNLVNVKAELINIKEIS